MSSIVSMPAPWSNRKASSRPCCWSWVRAQACRYTPLRRPRSGSSMPCSSRLRYASGSRRKLASSTSSRLTRRRHSDQWRETSPSTPSAAFSSSSCSGVGSQPFTAPLHGGGPAPPSRSGCSPSVSRRSRTVFVRWMRRFSKTSGSIEKPRPSSVARAYQSMNSPAGNRDEKPPVRSNEVLRTSRALGRAPGCGSSGHWTRARSSSVRSGLTNCRAWQSTPSRSPVASSAATWSPSLVGAQRSSASRNAIASPFAACAPALRAGPPPACSCRMQDAPSERARSPLPSVEPSSTTMSSVRRRGLSARARDRLGEVAGAVVDRDDDAHSHAPASSARFRAERATEREKRLL